MQGTLPAAVNGLHLSAIVAMMGDVTPEERAATPLLGRRDELVELADRVGLGTDPRPTPVVLGGDAGMGKTRLLTELGDRARREGWQVLVGHCLDFGDSALPLLPFTEVLGRLDDEARERLAPVVRHHPDLARLLPSGRVMAAEKARGQGDGRGGMTAFSPQREIAGEGTTGRSSEDDGAVRGTLFEALHAALEMLAADRPVLLIIEDVHWADRSTRDLLTYLYIRGFTTSVSVVASYRADDLHRRHPLRPTLAEWGRMPSLARMHLSPLADADVRALVRAVRPELTDQGRVEEIVRRAEGNAFFTEELLVAQELGPGTGSLPTELADLLLIRLDRLPADARAVVRAAACVGRRVPHLLLAEIVDLPPDDLDRALRAAVEANVLVARSDGAYVFRHALLGEAVYDDLLPGERARIHAACARALAERRVPGAAAELARHARAGHDPVTAVRASVEAGEDSMRLGGPDEAAGHFLTALDLLSAPGVAEQVDVDRTTLVLHAAEALINAGHPPKALALLHDEVGEVGSAATDESGRAPEERASMLIALAGAVLLVDAPPVSALAATAEALDLLGDQRTTLRARALAAHARSNVDRGRFDEATRLAHQAYDLAKELGAQKIQTEAATTLGRLKAYVGEHDAALDAMTGVVARLRREGDPAGLLRALHQLGGILFERGRLEESRAAYREAAELGERHGRRWAPYGFDARLLGGLAAYMVGDWTEVDRIADVSGGPAPPQLAGMLRVLALQTLAGRGDPGATAALDAQPGPTHPDAWQVILETGPAIDIRGDSGDLAGAVTAHDWGVARVKELWRVEVFPAQVRLAALLLGHLATAAGTASGAERRRLADLGVQRVRDAEAFLREAEERDRASGPEGVAWTLRLRAELLRLRRAAGVDPPGLEELVPAWQQTVEAFARLGHRFEHARSAVRLAAVLASAGPEQGDRVRKLVDVARGFGEAVGALPLLTEVHAAVGGGAARSQEGLVELTPREREVLGLVAVGRSNGEIGRALFIATKTVSVHVSNILGKLGVTSRTEAAAVARDRGLLG